MAEGKRGEASSPPEARKSGASVQSSDRENAPIKSGRKDTAAARSDFNPSPGSAASLLGRILPFGRREPLEKEEIVVIAGVIRAAAIKYADYEFRTSLTIRSTHKRAFIVGPYRDVETSYVDEASGKKKEITGRGRSLLEVSDIIPNLDNILYKKAGEVDVAGSQYHIKLYGQEIIAAVDNNEYVKSETDKNIDHQRPRPDLPRWAEQNRPTQLLQVRIAPELKAAVEQAARDSNQSRTDWVREALEQHLARAPGPKRHR